MTQPAELVQTSVGCGTSVPRRCTLLWYTIDRCIVVQMAIQTFANTAVERFFLHGQGSAKAPWSAVRNVAQRKLDMLDYASRLEDLRAPPGNRLEALKGKLFGFYSIRINDQWRIVFRWTEHGPSDVDIVDYH